MTLQEAYKIAQKCFPKEQISDCVQLEEGWAFYFGESIPGKPYVRIHYDSIQPEYLTVPPLRNLKIVQNGKRIPLEELK